MSRLYVVVLLKCMLFSVFFCLQHYKVCQVNESYASLGIIRELTESKSKHLKQNVQWLYSFILLSSIYCHITNICTDTSFDVCNIDEFWHERYYWDIWSSFYMMIRYIYNFYMIALIIHFNHSNVRWSNSLHT